ncbi:1211_t:CDS:1, partial [Cetraspora pellucida]
HVNGKEWDPIENDRIFHHHTNLPATLILQKGSRVMYLENTLFDHGLCNGTIGVITELIDENTINVVFPTSQ